MKKRSFYLVFSLFTTFFLGVSSVPKTLAEVQIPYANKKECRRKMKVELEEVLSDWQFLTGKINIHSDLPKYACNCYFKYARGGLTQLELDKCNDKIYEKFEKYM